jgi:hypothetical protein
MNLGAFVTRIKLQVPNLGQSGVTDAYLKTLIGSAVDAVNALCKVWAGYTDFNIEAGKSVYEISLVCPTYLGRDKRGLFFKDSNDKWQEVTPKTEAWLAKRYPDYLNASSVDIPQYYYIKGNEIGFYPPPLTSKALGCRLYHLKIGNPMTQDSHFPFSGTTTEITAFRVLDDAIIAWIRFKLSPAYGQASDVDIRYREYINECKIASMQIRRSPDLSGDLSNGIKVG